MNLATIVSLANAIEGNVKMLKEISYASEQLKKEVSDHPQYTRIVRTLRADASELLEELK